MFGNPSLMTRIAVGKTIGFIIGLIGFFLLPYFLPDVAPQLRWAILFWYTTLGAIIGVFGVFTYHPILKMPMPWWLMAPSLGVWMNLLLALLIYDDLSQMMLNIFGNDGLFSSPYWIMLEGAIIGLLIGYFATKYGGDGKETVQ